MTQGYTAFVGMQNVASGSRQDVHNQLREQKLVHVVVFEDCSGKVIDFDLTRPYQSEVVHTGPGRPKLGVRPREVTLLPRHWEWLDSQPGGASARIRRLVEAAMNDMPPKERIRVAQDVTTKVLTALAGDLPNYEEVTRALYRRDSKSFFAQMAEWPQDVQAYALKLSQDVFLDA